TEPVPDVLTELGWQGGEALADSRMFLHYSRTTPDGRILMGSGSGPMGLGRRCTNSLTRHPTTFPSSAAPMAAEFFSARATQDTASTHPGSEAKCLRPWRCERMTSG